MGDEGATFQRCDDHLYFLIRLPLEKLADALHIRPGYLSQVLNEHLGMNFYEFLNEHRVREVQSRMADPARSDRTLLALAHESGFNSKASFNRVQTRDRANPQRFLPVAGRWQSQRTEIRLDPWSETTPDPGSSRADGKMAALQDRHIFPCLTWCDPSNQGCSSSPIARTCK
ncbi:MAG: helix-turn-helix domain-containing protein [Longimicrobiales bacterium]